MITAATLFGITNGMSWTMADIQVWGDIFQSFGASLDVLSSAPTDASLAKAEIYIIVDPDNEERSSKARIL
jgi:hypothetical protein